MSRRRRSPSSTNLVLAAIAILLAAYLLVSQPTSESTTISPISHTSSVIPLGQAPISKPADLQGSDQTIGSTYSPQSAAQIKPEQLQNLSL